MAVINRAAGDIHIPVVPETVKMEFTGIIHAVGLSEEINHSIVILELDNGNQLQLPVTDQMAQAFGRRLYQRVALKVSDPVIVLDSGMVGQ